MANSIIVFTLNGCGHCVELKQKLNDANLSYNEIEISSNQHIWDQVVSQTGHNSLPTVYVSIDGGDNGPVFVPGRDYTDKDEFIKVLKTYI